MWTTANPNGDRKTDLVYIYPPGNIVESFLSTGDGKFQRVSYGLPSGFDPGGGRWVATDYPR
jgi:hypothetical protein